MKETFQNNQQNCNLYIVMMKAKDKLKSVEERIHSVEKDQSCIKGKIKFAINKGTLDILKPEAFGELSLSESTSSARTDGTRTMVRHEKPTAARARSQPRKNKSAEYVQDINVASSSDMKTCWVTGSVTLPGNRLLIADCESISYGNGNVKLVDVKQGQVITQLKLSSRPWAVAMVTTSQVAVTLPLDKKVAVVNVSAFALTVNRTLGVSGACRGVDYRDGKLAVSFNAPDGVQILTLQGQVLYTITNDKAGQTLFNESFYVVFGKDNTTLYVSNFNSSNVVHIKFDGTVLGTYTDRELNGPTAVLTDNSGNVYVCGISSHNIHQISLQSDS